MAAKVRLAGEAVADVDLEACAPQSDLLAELRDLQGRPKSLSLENFPGGSALLRCVLAHFKEAAAGGAADGPADLRDLQTPPLTAESLGTYLEAAFALRSASLARSLAQSPACRELSSRCALPLLERVLLLTTPREAAGSGGFSSDKVFLCGSQHPFPGWSNAMEGAFAEVISQLCLQLDPRDFRLGPPLAKGSAQASLAVLRAYRAKYQEASGGIDSTIRSTATLSVLGAGSQFGERRDAQRVEWTEHQFALHVLQLHLEQETQLARSAGTARRPRPQPLPGDRPAPADSEPNKACDAGEGSEGSSVFNECVEEEDIAEDVCDEIPDAALARLADFAAHLELSLTPPITAAAMVRAWLLVQKEDRADALFQAVFQRSPKVRMMVVEREIPVAFLRGVHQHYAASVTLRRMLARYETTSPAEICNLVEDLLFDELMAEEHSYQAILQHDIVHRLILWMRSGGLPGGAKVGARGFEDPGASAPPHVVRLREVGERLFEVAFTAHGGFLPKEVDLEAVGGQALVEGSCPWDTGELDLPLLSCVPPTEDSLQLARLVLLRGVWRRHDARGVDVPALARDWPLGRWTLCRDPLLIGGAFALLTACWRALAGLPGLGDLAGAPPATSGSAPETGSDGRRAAQELLFKMFTDLEVWRLPAWQLLTPWVPGQVLACHVAAQCSKLEDRQLTLVEETRENLEEIARLHAVIAQLSGRLEATDARSEQCMQKQADLNDTLRHLR